MRCALLKPIQLRPLVAIFLLSLSPILACAATSRSAPILTASSAKTGKYQKIEFQIALDPASAASCANPCDPDEVDLTLEIQASGGKTITLPAFYAQPYEYRQLNRSPSSRNSRGTDWFYPSGSPVWQARFAPDATGTYTCRALLRDHQSSSPSASAPVSFECVPSSSKGFVRVAPKNPRYFELSEGGTFFPIGQDLAFIGDSQYVSLSKAREIFEKMGRNGANYTRVWTCCGDWAMALEARKSAWTRSWDKKSAIVDLPDTVELPGSAGAQAHRRALALGGDHPSQLNVSPSHTVALRPSTRYVLSGNLRTTVTARASLAIELGGRPLGDPITLDPSQPWTQWRREFTTPPGTWQLPQLRLRLSGNAPAFLSDLSLKESGAGPELLWEADPNRPARGVYNPLDCFLLDKLVEAAEANGIRLQLCFLTRDLYMSALKNPSSPEYTQAIRDARKLARYAVARWGYSTSIATWEYWNEMNPGLPTDRFYAELGQYLEKTDPYHHLRATSAWGPSEKDWRHPVLDVADLHHYMRPVNGALAKDEVAAVLDRAAFLRQRAPRRPALLSEFGLADDKWGQSPYMRQDAGLGHFHNALWASALSGLSGTAMFWWWEQLDRQDCYHHYRPLAAFVKDIPFATEPLRPAAATITDPRVRAIGLAGPERADFWLVNSETAWARRVIDKTEPKEVRNATLQIQGLVPGRYQVNWWETGEGRVIHQDEIQVGAGKSTGDGAEARCAVPPFTTDLAVKIRRVEGE